MSIKTILCGAAGRDFHNFNLLYRNNDNYRVVAFTAAQIPDIDGRCYPPELAGALYPDGIPIIPEADLADIIIAEAVDEVLFSYSDVSFQQVMHLASISLAAGANFKFASPESTMIPSKKPVVSVCAVRTGCGKSQTSRAVGDILTNRGRRVVAVRHPMPYGNLVDQKVQRFAEIDDLRKHRCTIEEMEEYEPHLERGRIIYSGTDYAEILASAEEEADVILWDGGNNDTPFYKSDLEIVVTDPHRAGHELEYHPGEVNFLRADVIVINKIDSAKPDDVALLEEHIASYNPDAIVIHAESELVCDNEELIAGKRVVVVEDGPTLTHGEMRYGAGIVAAQRLGASEILDPRPWVTGTIAETFAKYPDIGTLIPAMGYGERQIRDLEETLAKIPCDTVIISTPVDLGRIITIEQPSVRITYELAVQGKPDLQDALARFII